MSRYNENELNKDLFYISENYKIITEKINNAMHESQKTIGKVNKVNFMAVTKTVPVNQINYAAKLGINLFGENRVQEFVGKYPEYNKNFEIHFIGGLQNNKVKYIINKVKMIESVNSIKLAEEINKRAALAECVMDILLEVNIAGEASKSGIEPDKLNEVVSGLSELQSIRLRGLMAIPPPAINCGNEIHFERMARIFSDIKGYLNTENKSVFNVLSMGMSYDFETAIKYGSNIVRIGRALFGERN